MKPIHAILAALVLTAAVVVWVQPWAVRDRGAGAPPKGVGATQPPADADYDLTTPSASFELPDELAEISALTDINDHTVACVQDEVGVVFWVDVRSGAVVRQLPFGDDGDYEGLARVGDALWVLRSDGLMVELVVRDGAFEIARQVQLDLDHRELEGLEYDPVDRVVLVAPKSPAKGGKSERARRSVFRFDPVAGALLDGLALDTTVERIVADAERAGIPLPTRTTKKDRERVDLEVLFSSVAVHPRTHRLYALSGVDCALLVFDRDSTLVGAHFFDPAVMPQPEGVAFLPSGDMVVASEGDGAPPRIQVFRYRGGGGEKR